MSIPISQTSDKDGNAQSDSNLARHIRHELMLVGEEQRVIDGLAEIGNIFAEVADSGGAHAAILPVLTRLLNFEHLSPLTDDPGEWQYHGPEIWGQDGGIWQNVRNSTAFSKDGGKTYYLLGEVHEGIPVKKHVSLHIEIKAKG